MGLTRKAQVKMFETISVLIIFFFILIFGLVYYNNTQKKEIQNLLDENNQLRVMETMKVAMNLPELQCSMENIQTTNCFELVKLQNFQEVVSNNKLYYTSLFSYSKLYVSQIYPSVGPMEWELYSSQPKSIASTQKNFIPILIYDSVNRRYNAGMLVVEVYS